MSDLTSLVNALLHGQTWTFVEDAESGGVIALDRSGLVMDGDRAQALFEGVLRFVNYYGADNILTSNLARSEEADHVSEQAIQAIKSVLRRQTGVVYLLKEPNGLIKIGMSTRSAEDRLAEFQPKLPFETDLIHVINCDNPLSVEAALHAQYGDKRIRGEWFALTAEDLENIKRMGDQV